MYCTKAPANRFIFPIRMVASNEFLSSPIASPSSAWNPICSVVVHFALGGGWCHVESYHPLQHNTQPFQGQEDMHTDICKLSYACRLADGPFSVLSPLSSDHSLPSLPSLFLPPSLPFLLPSLLPLPHHLYVLVLVTRWIFSLDVAFLIS